MRYITFFFSLITLATMFPSQAQVYDLFKAEVHKQGSDKLNYRFLAPEKVEADQTYPLLIFLHGAGERGKDNRRQLVHVMPQFTTVARRQQYPCYIIAPQCPEKVGWGDGEWHGARDGGYTVADEPSIRQQMIMAVVKEKMKEFPIDESRIYVAGLSMGGAGTWSMMAHYPDVFAAAVPICGAGDVETASKIKDIPTWIFHGTDDIVVPATFSVAMQAALQAVGGTPILTLFETVNHDSWVNAFDENPFVYDWLFSQKKSD